MAYLLQKNLRSATGRWNVALVLIIIILSACTTLTKPGDTPSALKPYVSAPTQLAATSITPTKTITPIAETAKPSAISLYTAPYIPDNLIKSIQLPVDVRLIDDDALAEYSMVLAIEPTTLSWIYALVAPFPTIAHGVSSSDLLAAWNDEDVQPFSGRPLLMAQDTSDLFTDWWGQPSTDAVMILPADELLDYAWGHQPAWALIPFDEIEPRWKVLEVDGQSPLRNTFDPQSYPLTAYFTIQDASGRPFDLQLSVSNREPDKLTVLAMTGVTALVRGTALWMERYGITYPAQDIGALLRQADLTHISNEIPFVSACPFPTIPTPVPTNQSLPLISFCSRSSYVSLLEEVGADLVELTGDHFADWGDEAMQYTLDLYADHDLPVYGGGMNAEQARRSLLVQHNGNKLAFLGCNIGWPARRDQIPESALATASHPGAAQCDFDWLSTEIPRLRTAGYQVIFTFQHREYDRMKAQPLLIHDFGLVASYGATVVSGSQAHQPHSMAFQDGAFIHYGLGNLFFDQYHFCADYACDYAFIDQHYFYDNRYLGVELAPIVFVDLARPRLMNESESTAYLAKIFEASGWEVSP